MSERVDLHPADLFGSDYLPEFNRVLDRYLVLRTGNVLEWGAGHTTYQILKRLDRTGCQRFVTVDDNPEYLRAVLRRVRPRSWFHPVAQDLTGPRLDQADPGAAYSTAPLLLDCRFDFVLIDGRRRVECAFVSTLLAHQETTVVLHDYRRGRYQPIRALFDILEDGPQFRVMRVRPDLLPLVRERAEAIGADLRQLNERLDLLPFSYDGSASDQADCV
jgi:hypothetical protein